MSDKDLVLPFKATHSEQRILRDLLAIATLRGDTPAIPDLKNTGLLQAEGINSAEELILYLQKKLFPEETLLREKRSAMLRPLQAPFLRTHFDQTLETAVLSLQVKIRDSEEFLALLEKLKGFDFDAWQRHCEGERTHAD